MRRAALLAALFAAGSAWAQTGALRVVVTDSSTGAPLPGAEVVVSGDARQVVPTTLRTGVAGAAEFPVLHAGGGYLIDVRLPGYTAVHLPGVRIPLERTLTLPVALVPELKETVAVSARRQGVDLEETHSSTTFTSEFTEELPLYGRFYQTLLTLAPGVLDPDEDGNPNVHGARETDFKTVVGGVANTDPLTGGFLSYVNLESVDALEVITAGAGAEFGRAQGGFANMVQKQGSNDFDGVAGFTFGTSLLDGNGAGTGEGAGFKRIFGLTLEGYNLLNDDTLRIQEIRAHQAAIVRRFGRRWLIGLRATF